eukprot:2337023-Prymnesium_polylepis.3
MAARWVCGWVHACSDRSPGMIRIGGSQPSCSAKCECVQSLRGAWVVACGPFVGQFPLGVDS